MDPELDRWRTQGQSFDYLGFDVFYRHEGTGPVLLLIHGYPFNSFDWQAIWPALRERFTLIAPDMLGMGFSAKPTEYEYSVHDHADMHEALLRHLGVSECHVLAHDIGHWPQLEDPQGVLTHFLAFVEPLAQGPQREATV